MFAPIGSRRGGIGPYSKGRDKDKESKGFKVSHEYKYSKMINLLVCIFASIVFITIANIFMNICIKKAMVIFAT